MSKTEIIVLAADHNGVALKQLIRERLKEMGHLVVDLGPYDEDGKVDYNHYAANLARCVQVGDATRGILVCGTGVGVNLVANRFSGVRAVLAHNMVTAEKSREHNDSNVLSLGAWVNKDSFNLELVEAWLENEWGDVRHSSSVNMIDFPKEGLVLANGVFDVVHRGHLELLRFARAQGSRLIVAIDSDRRVRDLKGESRPVNSKTDRRYLLENLTFVDEVIVFEEAEDLQELYTTLKPSVVVKGSEWTSAEVRKRDNIPDEIAVKVFPLIDGLSSTAQIAKYQGKV